MLALLVIDRRRAAIDRETTRALVATLAAHGHAVTGVHAPGSARRSALVELAEQIDRADRLLLIEPEQAPTSWATAGRDPLTELVRARVDDEAANGIAATAVLLAGLCSSPALPPHLATLPRFVLDEPPAGSSAHSGNLADLLAWLARDPAPERSLRTCPLPAPDPDAVPLTAGLAALEQAVGAALGATSGRRVVWIRGGPGSGKTTLLGHWLAKGRHEHVLVHAARCERATTRDPQVVLDRLAAALSATSGDGSPLLLVLDGVERLLETPDVGVTSDPRERLAAMLAGSLPPRVVIVAATRALPDALAERIPDLDLDAPAPWAEERRRVAEALLTAAGVGSDRAAQVQLAGARLDVARDLAELGDAGLDDSSALPRGFATLERAWVSALDRAPAERRSTLRAGLALLADSPAPVPTALLAALDPDLPALLRQHLPWVAREQDGQIGLHPADARFFRHELEGFTRTAHQRLLEVVAQGSRGSALPESVTTYLTTHQSHHHQRALGLGLDQIRLREVPALRRAAATGSLRRVVADALAHGPRRDPLDAAIVTVLRQLEAALHREPERLGLRLWTELVARGFTPAALERELSWGDQRPPLRLQHPLTYVDTCERSVPGHQDRVTGCAIAADASLAVSVGLDRLVRVFDPSTGDELRRLELGGSVHACAMTPDGETLVVARARQPVVVDVRRGTVRSEQPELESLIEGLAISADGRIAIAGDLRGNLVVWDPSEPGSTTALPARRERITHCAIAPNGRVAATGQGDGVIDLWSLPTGEHLGSLAGHRLSVGAFGFGPDSARLVSVGISEACVWDVAKRELLAKYPQHGRSCAALAVVASGEEVVMADDGRLLTRWRIADGALLDQRVGHARGTTCLATTPDGDWVVTGGADRLARVWQRDRACEGALPGLAIDTRALIPGERPGTVWAYVDGHATRSVSVADGRTRVELEDRPYTRGLAVHGRALYLSSWSQVLVFDAQTGARSAEWPRHDDDLSALALDRARERLACGSDDGRIYVYGLDGRERERLSGHGRWINDLRFTPDGGLVSADQAGKVLIWPPDLDGPPIAAQVGLQSAHVLASNSAGTELLAAGDGGRVVVFDRRGQVLRELVADAKAIHGLDVGHDDALVVCAGHEGWLRVHALEDGRVLASFATGYPLTSVRFVGDHIVAGDLTGNLLIFAVDWSKLRA